MTLVDRVWKWPYELKDLVLKKGQTLGFSEARIKFVPFNDSRWKKRIFKEVGYSVGLTGIKLKRY